MALHSPLDLQHHFVTVLAGSEEIFSFLAILVVGFAMAKYNLPSKISLPLFALFAVIMAAYMQAVYVLVILIVGITTYYSLSKIGR